MQASAPRSVAVGALAPRELALDHLERLGARQLGADTHERRPLLGPEIRLLGQEAP